MEHEFHMTFQDKVKTMIERCVPLGVGGHLPYVTNKGLIQESGWKLEGKGDRTQS